MIETRETEELQDWCVKVLMESGNWREHIKAEGPDSAGIAMRLAAVHDSILELAEALRCGR